MNKRKQTISEAVHKKHAGIVLTKEERAWMQKQPARYITKTTDGSNKDFAILSYDPENEADKAMADKISRKVEAAGGFSLAFLVDDYLL